MSMAFERQYDLPAESNLFLQPDTSTSNFCRDKVIGQDAFKFLFDYVSRSHDAQVPPEVFSSAFEADMPGVMRLKEVEQEIDLGEWRLQVRDMIVSLQVRLPYRNHPNLMQGTGLMLLAPWFRT